ncbi:hypothetical protein FRC07_014342 [Ceratobasidium sp. 392]|nr:hypothetical protein FRC07_014342 [Ceratobasidium sp. 392]
MAARCACNDADTNPPVIQLTFHDSRINSRGSKRPGPEINEGEPVAGPSSLHTLTPDERPSKKSQHTEMELAKVNDVILDESGSAEGPSDPTASNRRSAALRARASLTALAPTRRNTNPNPSTHAQTDLNSTPATDRASRQIRRARNSLGAPADSMVERRRRRVGGMCPVCEEDVAEDLEEHVDRCLQDAVLPHRVQAPMREEPAPRQRSDSPEHNELVRATDFTDFRGKSRAYPNEFDLSVPDIEDELDIDGDEDTVLYGESQFFESDIIARDGDDTDDGSQRHRSPTSEGSGPPTRRLRDLVAARKMEVTIREVDIEGEEEDERVSVGSSTGAGRVLPWSTSAAPEEGGHDKDAHISLLMAKIERLESALQQASQANTPVRTAFHAKVKSVSAAEDATPTVCRICLDAFVEPVVSTGCWHLFCRECWLQSLGSTKYCPICKRITSTSNLRKVYL